MNLYRKNSTRGFSLVELLAVVLVLAVLAAVAIPLYTSQRKSAAGRTCKANIAAISSALSAWALRANAYPASGSVMSAYVAGNPPTGGLIGAPEGLTQVVTCPLTGAAYTYGGGGAAAITITCPNDAAHAGFGGTNGDWTKTLAAPAADNLP